MENNIIHVDFSQQALNVVNDHICMSGVKAAELFFIKSGVHPSFIRALIKKVLRLRGGSNERQSRV